MGKLHKTIPRVSIIFIAVFVLMLFASGTAMGPTAITSHDIMINVNEIALLGLNNTDPISFIITEPSITGNSPLINPTFNSSKKLFYTSIVKSKITTRKVTASIDKALPDGFKINLFAFDPIGGTGDCGTTQGPIDLSTTTQSILGDIKSGWTGRTIGAPLLYMPSFDLLKFNQLYARNDTFAVTFTLTDQ